MRKIKYPADPVLLKEFHKRYLALFAPATAAAIDMELSKAPAFDSSPLTFERLITADFDQLRRLKLHLMPFADSYDVTKTVKGQQVTENAFKDLFDYGKMQPYLAGFFMNERHLKMKTCYYCGIDYINSFKSIADYENANDFINRAPAGELKIVTWLGDAMAKRIIKLRSSKYITSFSEFTTDKRVIAQLNAFDFKNTHNHFTLDHIIPQGAYRFLSLSLYNLSPSCYSCNAKFKKDINFLDNSNLTAVSPTSADYSLNEDLKFKILYSGRLKDIKNTSDFILTRSISKNTDQVEKYIEIFKLDGRYAAHKDIILEMIETKINYPPWKIRVLSREMRKSYNETRKLIFGKEIFDTDSSSPLHKLKRDIAKALKII